MSQVKEDLERALAVLEERGWCQRGADSESPEGCPVCVESAIAVATMGDARLWSVRSAGKNHIDVRGVQLPAVTQEQVDRHLAALRAFCGAIGLGWYHEVGWYHEAWSWNDRFGRTADEVKDMLRRAIEACEEVPA